MFLDNVLRFGEGEGYLDGAVFEGELGVKFKKHFTMEKVTEKIARYSQILTAYIEDLAEERNTALGGTADCNVIADNKNHQYQLTRIGWEGRKYYFIVLLHFSIKPDGKVWIQQNNTEILIGGELEQRGVEKMDIVVGFRPAYLREATGYAVA